MVGVSKRKPGQLVRCTKCGIEKPWDTEHFASENGRPRVPCRACRNAARDERARRTPEQTRDGVRQRMARWRENNPERVKAANRRPRAFNRELAQERINRWKREHPESRRVEDKRRKAMKRNLPHDFTVADWRRCLDYWGHRCCVCGRAEDGDYFLAQEHWIPLADQREGNPGTVPWNMLPMCHSRWGKRGGCNNAKHKRDPIVWLRSRLGEEAAATKLAEIAAYFNAVTPPAMRLLVERVLATLAG